VLDLIHSIGNSFSHEQYMFWSRVEGTLWTAADVVLVVFLLRTTNLFRRYLGIRLHRISYIIVALTLPLAVFIPFHDNARTFFYLELAVTVPHFLLILYLCIGDAGNALRAISDMSQDTNLARDGETAISRLS